MNVKNPVAAASIHLSVCLLVAAILLSLFWFLWYPYPLFYAVGGFEIFLLLLVVDVVLGPLLTLIVFKTGKRTLTLDLTVIAVVQIVALSYGIITLLEGRPVFIAALGEHFQVVTANNVLQSDLDSAGASLPWTGPRWVGTTRSLDKERHDKLILSGMGGGGYGATPEFHVALSAMAKQLIAKSSPIELLAKNNPSKALEIKSWLRTHDVDETTAVYQALTAAYPMAVIIDKRTGLVVGIAPFSPRG
jgi:hypothetical protein